VSTEHELLTFAEAMAFFRYNDRKAFWRFVRRFRIAFVPINGKRVLFKRTAIDAFLAQRTVNAKGIA
jgi:hypothetical protein